MITNILLGFIFILNVIQVLIILGIGITADDIKHNTETIRRYTYAVERNTYKYDE